MEDDVGEADTVVVGLGVEVEVMEIDDEGETDGDDVIEGVRELVGLTEIVVEGVRVGLVVPVAVGEGVPEFD